MHSNSTIPAISRLFRACSKPTQIKCLKHLTVGERAHVALEKAMGNSSYGRGEQNKWVTHDMIICLSITTHETSKAGLTKKTMYAIIVTGKVMSVSVYTCTDTW